MPLRSLRKDRDVPVDGSARLALVDRALASLSRRDFVNGEEAAGIFRDLRTSCGDHAGESITELLDRAVLEYGNDGVWGVPTVADTLLDLRLLITDQESATSSP